MKIAARSGEQAFLRSLFDALRQVGHRYAVMRNYGTLPVTVSGSDLDLLVGSQGGDDTLDLVLRAAEAIGGVAIGQTSQIGFRKLFLLGRGEDGHWWGLRVDVNCGLAYKGARLLIEDFGAGVQSYRGISVLEPGLAGVLGVLKELLFNNSVPARYLEPARLAAENDWCRVRALLDPMGGAAIEAFRTLLITKGAGPCPDQARRLRADLARHAVRREGLGYVRKRLLSNLSKARRYLFPSGAVIAVLGVDGVGKSTVIEGILPALTEATHGACRMRHLRPGLLPPLSRIKGGSRPEQGAVLDPHAAEPSGMLGSLARVGWLLADYLIGYWLRVRPFIAKQPGIFLFDRYAYDMAIDPRRFRIALPDRLIRWLARLAPRPNLIVCLHASPSTILSRKQELPEEEVRRQLDALTAFAAREPRAVLVSTEGTQEEVRERVLQALRDFFDRRARRKRIRADAA